MMFRFSIREAMLMMALFAVGLGWWLDHREISQKYETCVAHLQRMRMVIWQAKDTLESTKTREGTMHGGITFEPQWELALHPSNPEVVFPVNSLTEKELSEFRRREKALVPSH
jgi:hypothetical protein